MPAWICVALLLGAGTVALAAVATAVLQVRYPYHLTAAEPSTAACVARAARRTCEVVG